MQANPWIPEAAEALGVSVETMKNTAAEATKEELDQLKNLLGLAGSSAGQAIASAEEMRDNI